MWNLLLLFGLKSVGEMRLKFRRCLIDGSAQVLVVNFLSYDCIRFREFFQEMCEVRNLDFFPSVHY